MPKLLTFLLLAACLLLAVPLIAQERGFPMRQSYSPERYGQSPQVFSAAKDHRGWMYFGINGQVMVYDGETWQTIAVPNQSSVYSVLQARHGTVYVGATGDFGRLRMQGAKLEYESLAHLLPDPNFRFTSLWQAIEHQGHVYFRSFEALIRYTPGANHAVKVYHRLKEGEFGGLISHRDRLYVYVVNVGLMEVREDGLQPAPYESFFDSRKLYAGFTFANDTALLVTRNHGLYLATLPQAGDLQPFGDAAADFLDQNDVYVATSLPNGHIALLSVRKGTFVIDRKGQAVQWIYQGTGVQSNYARQVLAAPHELWITSNTGIERVESDFDISYWDKQAGLDGLVESIARHGGRVYVGTQSGCYWLGQEKAFPVSGIPVGQTWAVKAFSTPDGQEHLMAGTSKGVFSIRGDQAFPLLPEQPDASANVLFQWPSHPDRFFSTQGKHLICFRYRQGKWELEWRYADLLEDIRGIAEAPDGSIWLGSFRNGAIRLAFDTATQQPSGYQYYTLDYGFPSLKDIMPHRYQNRLLFGTEKGLYAYDPATGRMEPFCEFGEELCDGRGDVFRFYTSENGAVWAAPLMTQQTPIRYRAPGDTAWITAPFRRVPKMMMRAFHVENGGEVVWMGGEKGLFRYEPAKDARQYDRPPPVYIRRILVGGDSLLYDGNGLGSIPSLADIPFEQNVLQVDFASPVFDHEDATLYSYRLRGADRRWSDWAPEGTAFYHYLKEGSYLFEVKARNIYGVESGVKQFEISFAPPLYRTWWAYSLYALACIAAAWGLVRLNIYRLEQEKRHLEAEIQKRTAELRRQKEQVELQKEEIMAKNVEILQQKEEIESQANSLMVANAYISEQKEALESTVKQRTEQIQRAFEELLLAHRQLDQLTYRSAHDLRGPIARLEGLCQVARLEFPQGAMMPYLQRIEAEAKQMDALLNRIMLTQSLKTKQPQSEPILLENLLRSIILQLKQQPSFEGVRVLVEKSEPIRVMSDTALVRHLIHEVLHNAFKFRDERQSQPTIRIVMETDMPQPDMVRIRVLDNGIGFSEKGREKAFELFFVDHETLRGHGLGLFDAHVIAEKLKGRVYLAPPREGWTEIVIELPQKANFQHWSQLIQ